MLALFLLPHLPDPALAGQDHSFNPPTTHNPLEMEARSPFLRRFLLLGPTARGPARGLRTQAALLRGLPARLPDPCGNDPARFHGRNWEVILSDRDVIDLEQWLGTRGSVAYLARPLHADSKTRARLFLGSDGPLKAWLNGSLILTTRQYRRHKLDRMSVPIVLEPGCNLLVIKTARGARWRVSVRIGNEEGFHLDGMVPVPLPIPPIVSPLPPLVVAPGGTLTVPIQIADHTLDSQTRRVNRPGDDVDDVGAHAHPIPSPCAHCPPNTSRNQHPELEISLDRTPRFARLENGRPPTLILTPDQDDVGRYDTGALLVHSETGLARIPLPIVVATPDALEMTPPFDAMPGCRYPLRIDVRDTRDRRLNLAPFAAWSVVKGSGGTVLEGGIFEARKPGRTVLEARYGGLVARIAINVVSGNARKPYLRRIATIPTLVAIYRTEDCATCEERARQTARQGRLFLYRNTNGQLNLDLDYTVASGPLPKKHGSYFQGIAADLKQRDLHRAAPGIVVGLGKSEGPCYGSGRMFGAAATHCSVLKPTFFVHEVQHALDRVITEESGLPDMVYGHGYTEPGAFGMPTFPIVAGRGADWEAKVLRAFPDYDRLAPPWDQTLLFADSDGDGLADADPRLPADERRFGSNPFLPDTDGDGLLDFQEFQAGIYQGSNPNALDTDGDGAADGRDPWPLFPMPRGPIIPYAHTSPQIDGALTETWPLITTGFDTAGQCLDNRSRDCQARGNLRTFATWNEQGIYFAFEADTPIREVIVNLDGSPENGPWLGGDLHVFRIRRRPSPSVQYAHTALPNDTRDTYNLPEGRAAFGRHRGIHTLEIAIPANPGPGAGWDCRYLGQNCNPAHPLHANKSIGLAFRIVLGPSAVTPFEQEVFVPFLLQDPAAPPTPLQP